MVSEGRLDREPTKTPVGNWDKLEREYIMWPSTMQRLGNWVSVEMAIEVGGCEIGVTWEYLIREVSVKRKGSSLREGHGVESTVCEEASLSFWRGGGEEVEEEERESSRRSAIWRTNGSEKAALILGVERDLGVGNLETEVCMDSLGFKRR